MSWWLFSMVWYCHTSYKPSRRSHKSEWVIDTHDFLWEDIFYLDKALCTRTTAIWFPSNDILDLHSHPKTNIGFRWVDHHSWIALANRKTVHGCHHKLLCSGAVSIHWVPASRCLSGWCTASRFISQIRFPLPLIWRHMLKTYYSRLYDKYLDQSNTKSHNRHQLQHQK